MALGGTYNTGLVGVTNASKAATGVGVIWSDVVEGDWLQVGAAVGVIDSVSGTFDGITLKDGWAGNSDSVITVTIASPAVVSLTAHGKSAGDPVSFFTTISLPPGLVAGATYYVIAAGLTSSAFEVSATIGGSAINTSGSQSGVHSIAQAYRILKMSWLRYDPSLTQQKLRQFINVIETASLFGVPFAWDIGTSDADPGAGNIRANNASLASATMLYISKTSRVGAGIAAFLAALDDSTSTSSKGILILGAQPDGTQAMFNVGAVTDATNYIKLAIAGPSGVTTFLSGALINFQFTRTGDLSVVSGVVLYNAPQSITDAQAEQARANIGVIGRNKIINGATEIDQRNAGALVTGVGSGSYTLDRWMFSVSGGGAINTQQVDASTATIGVTMPPGFKNAMYLKCATADASIAAGDLYLLSQSVEGLNCTDLDFGLSTAKIITLSFWVRSSVTGTYGGSIRNSVPNRSYPFQYIINSANTWEKKTITIAGDSAGTWLTTNGIGLYLILDLGSGSTYQGTVNAWGGANYFTALGSTQWIATANATFYLTGVQLEVGSVATPFERRQYGTELMLCQRYYEIVNFYDYGTAATGAYLGSSKNYRVIKRAVPTLTNSLTVGTGQGAVANSGNYPYAVGFSSTLAASGIMYIIGNVIASAEL